MAYVGLILLGAGSGWLTWWGTGQVIPWLRRRVLDIPNARSSHATPTPRGGGVVLVCVAVVAWLLIGGFMPQVNDAMPWLLLPFLLLAMVSFLDDISGVAIRWRLLAQTLAVVIGLVLLPADVRLAEALLPLPVERLLTGILWLWFINLFNFMDGIDGISGVETASIAAGVLLLALVGAVAMAYGLYAAVLLGGAVGFLRWNWAPAVVFLGDVGSVSLGYLLGWLLLMVAASGHPVPAMLLALYYLGDATCTLLHRAVRGEKIWQAHRRHFYQQAARGWGSHARVSKYILALNAGLIGLALTVALGPLPVVPALVIGLLATAVLMWLFARKPKAAEGRPL